HTGLVGSTICPSAPWATFSLGRHLPLVLRNPLGVVVFTRVATFLLVVRGKLYPHTDNYSDAQNDPGLLGAKEFLIIDYHRQEFYQHDDDGPKPCTQLACPESSWHTDHLLKTFWPYSARESWQA